MNADPTWDTPREAIVDAADRWARSHGCRDIRFCNATPLDAFEAGWKARADNGYFVKLESE